MPIEPRDPPKRFTLSSLPTEILIRIVALSQNIDSVRYTDTFFLKFVEEHEDNLFRALVDHYYVYRMNSAVSLDTSFKSNRLTDAEHKENSLSLSIEAMQRGASKRRYSGEYQLKDSIVVIDCEAFNQPYIKHRIMRRLHVDAVLTSSEIASLKEEVKTSLAKLKADLENSYEETLIGSERLVKGVLLNSYMEKSRIPFPFLDHRNPSNLDYLRAGDYADKLRIIRDIMHLNPIFEGDVESMLWFLIEINDQVQQDHAAASTPGEEYVGKDADNRLRLQEVKQLLVRQLKKDANTTTTTPSFTNGDLIISILTKTSKRWIRYLLQFVSPASLEEDQYFWGRIMQSKRLDYIRSLEKYSKLSPGPQVLSVLAKSSQ
ncbi:DEKNAAC103665 [Brettanomyces naardenensis]|uniref:DEKNAAC103665 n=1 Tax=Brettanomyces naardenensis TaxID=13370 RepID=A0A448YNV5_BRENA|nr:DEKNAAC103665 [Brettanomyces naardenensis]